MRNGDLLIVPHGAEHEILHQPGAAAKPLAAVLGEVEYEGSGALVYGGGGSGCCLVCGEFSFDEHGAHPLLENLPILLQVSSADGPEARWLQSTMAFIAREASLDEPGAGAIVDRLSEIILIQVLRATLDQARARGETLPFLSAFADARINRALTAIHQQPAADWTVERLGSIAHMSRSSFASRFNELVQMTPLQYVTFVRLEKARKMLRETGTSVAVVAETIGYQSEAAFSQTFKRYVGLRPGQYRRRGAELAA
jgi:AraC-like DNA-binding protein